MKKTYTKPVLVKERKLSAITASVSSKDSLPPG